MTMGWLMDNFLVFFPPNYMDGFLEDYFDFFFTSFRFSELGLVWKLFNFIRLSIKAALDWCSFHFVSEITKFKFYFKKDLTPSFVIAAVLTSRQMSWTAVQLLPQQRWCRKNAPKPIVQVRALECTFTVHCTGTPNGGQQVFSPAI